MATIENQPVTNYRDSLRERMQARFPDRNFSGENVGEGEDVQDVLLQSLSEALDEYEGQTAKYNESSEQLKKLLASDPRSTSFIMKWMQSGDPRAALVEEFGDDLSELATEEGRGKFGQSLQTWRDNKATEDQLSAEAEANWGKSLESLDAWGDKKGLTQEQKVDVIVRLVSVAADGLLNKYSEEDFEMALKAMNFDTAVSDARREGLVTGRNANIEAQRRQRQSVGAMPPSITGGQGMRVRNDKPEKPESIWSGIK